MYRLIAYRGFESRSLRHLALDSADIKRACELACVHDDIMQTPMGYDSLIGDMGSTLSFGQQQRVFLARALCKNPEILFLDEGTAHVDGPKETQIMKNLCALDLTCVYVTHNPNLLDFATSVVTWEADGSIVQTPTESKQAP